MTAVAIALSDLLLTAGINYLLKKQEVDAIINQARAEGREITPEELAKIKSTRDALYSDTMSALDAAAKM